MTVEVLDGRPAEILLGDPSFREQWAGLHARCAWATVFQGPGFATAWYDVYRPAYAPLLVVERDAAGMLTALLALGRARSDDSLCAAGAYHAEYQCWLAGDADNGAFAGRAFGLVRQQHPRSSLTLRYLPHGAPLGWLATTPLARRGLIVREESRPIMDLGDGSAASEWLGRKKHRDRLRRLARGGGLTFEELADSASLEAVMDRFLDLYDFRQGAINGAPASRRDPHHRAFYLALMGVPALLHVTVQRRADTPLSMHINVRNGSEITLGLMAQTPTDAENSPGVFHIQQLARMAAAQGFRILDLTPGTDAYKDRFATRREAVHVLELRTSPQALAASVRAAVRRSGRRAVERIGLDPERVRDALAHARSGFAAVATPGGTKALVHDIRSARGSGRVLRFTLNAHRLGSRGARTELDSIAALLAYRPGPLGARPRRAFLATALARFGAGQRSASIAIDGELILSAWIAVAGTRYGPELDAAMAGIPSGVAIVHDVRLRGLAGVSAPSMVAGTLLAAAGATGSDTVVVLVQPSDRPLIAALRELGGVMGIRPGVPMASRPPNSATAPASPAPAPAGQT